MGVGLRGNRSIYDSNYDWANIMRNEPVQAAVTAVTPAAERAAEALGEVAMIVTDPAITAAEAVAQAAPVVAPEVVAAVANRVPDTLGVGWGSRYTGFPYRIPSGSEAYQAVTSRMPAIDWSWRPSMPAMPSFDRDAALAALSNNPRTSMIAGAAIVLAGGYLAWRLMSPAQKAATTAAAAAKVDQAIQDTSNDAAIAAALAAEEGRGTAGGAPTNDRMFALALARADQEAADAQLARRLGHDSMTQRATDAAIAAAMADSAPFVNPADVALAQRLQEEERIAAELRANDAAMARAFQRGR